MADSETKERDKTPQEKADAAKVTSDHEAAKAAGVEMVALTVDGVDVEVPKGTLVIEAAFRAGADIPYFCYHPRLTSVGACRMCLASVELEMFGQRRASIMATCTVPCSNGMVIKTSTPDVKKAQGGILEFLLANHPLDCPICDRGGECPLQNMTIAYGPPTSRYIEEKRHFPKAQPISDFVVLDRERCIQCMRCTRFAEEIAGDSQISLLNRGANAEIGPFLGATFDSNFSGNTIEICPVGALTSRNYRFKGRPWEVKSVDSVCSRCGNGCNIAVQHRLGEVVRINGRTNEDVNEEWTCDRGKFGQTYVNDAARLTTPLVRDVTGNLVPTDWSTALGRVAEALAHYRDRKGPQSVAGIGSTRATLEDNYLFGKLMRGRVGTNHLDHRLDRTPLWGMETSIAAIEGFAKIVSVAMDLPMDQPIIYLRVQKAVRKKSAQWIAVDSVADAASHLDANTVLLLPHGLAPDDYITARGACTASGAKCNVLARDCNSVGAARAGILPDGLPGGLALEQGRAAFASAWGGVPETQGADTDGIFDGCVSGDVGMLYVMGSDPATRHHDPEKAIAALDAVEFLVVQELFLTETARRADVVLPAASFAEKDGTFVNVEGREQAIHQAIEPRGDCRPDWRILADLLARLGAPAPYFSARDVYREYARTVAAAGA